MVRVKTGPEIPRVEPESLFISRYLLGLRIFFITGHTSPEFIKTILAVHFATFSTRRHRRITVVGMVNITSCTGKLDIVIHVIPSLDLTALLIP